MWSPGGASALKWLKEKRGLKEETTKRYHLGFHPKECFDNPSRWGLDGKQIWLPRGIVIPCIVEKAIWNVNIRRSQGDPKYFKVRGNKAALYGADNLRGSWLDVLVEGEFDAILASQEIGDVCGVASLGSATNKLNLTLWGSHLLPAKSILVANDSDEAGYKASRGLAMLSAQIYPIRIPTLSSGDKDITDYVMAGGDLWEWLKHHLYRLKLI